jgi:hypothetical protein
MASISQKGVDARKAKAEARKQEVAAIMEQIKGSDPYKKLELLLMDVDSWTQKTVLVAQSYIARMMMQNLVDSDVGKNLKDVLKDAHGTVAKIEEGKIIDWDTLPDKCVLDAILFLKRWPVFGKAMDVPQGIKRRAFGFDFDDVDEPEPIMTPEEIAQSGEWA